MVRHGGWNKYARSNLVPRNALGVGKASALCIVVVLTIAQQCYTDCPEGWSGFRDFCFRTTDDKSDSFELAEHSCRKLHPSAHLASIHTESENDAAASAAGNQTVWIGLKLVKGRLRWSDKTYLDYTNYPDEKTAHENSTCLQLSGDKKWRSEMRCDREEANAKGKSDDKSKSKRAVYGQISKFQETLGRSIVKRSIRVKRKKSSKSGGSGLAALCKVPHMQTCGGPDWIRAGEFCYNFSSPLDKRDWNQASAGCLEMDARFVAVFNLRQNDVLRRLAHLTGEITSCNSPYDPDVGAP